MPMPDVMSKMILLSEFVMQARMGSLREEGGNETHLFSLEGGQHSDKVLPQGSTIWVPDVGEVTLGG